MSTVLIVGAGHAGGRTAQALRAAGYTGAIRLLGSEPHLPYERPPLSKDVLTGDAPVDKLFLAPPAAWADQGIVVEAGRTVRTVDAAACAVETADGARLGYDHLVVATGGRPRLLQVPGAAAAGVHYLRGIDDALALRSRLAAGTRLCVIGGGVIGLEVAASARRLGATVTVIEAAPALLGRVAPAAIGEWMAEQHRANGVELLLADAVEGLEHGADGTIVRTRNGCIVVADVVVAGIGIEPNVELLAGTGVDISDGVLVDAWGRSADPRIFAVGDVARVFHPRLGMHLRGETWRNAENHGHAVAAAITGGPLPAAPLPWMWSDQYDVNLQVAGVVPRAADWVLRGSPGQRKFTMLALADGKVAAGCTINQGRDMRFVQQLIGCSVDRAALADEGTALQALARALPAHTN
jgi:NADPH-dependent 2,4-dienoyl-CoA reductase/sulfur reductase-like enzyme